MTELRAAPQGAKGPLRPPIRYPFGRGWERHEFPFSERRGEGLERAPNPLPPGPPSSLLKEGLLDVIYQ